MKYFWILFVLHFMFFFDGVLQAQWVQTNGPFGGTVYSLLKNNSGDIFAGTSSGLFRSNDNGNNWSQLYDVWTNYNIKSLAINSNGDMFAGISGGDGVFRSTNNGNNWTQIINTWYRGVNSLAINSSGFIFAGTEEGVYRSTDNGDNWSLTNNGLAYTRVISLAINTNGYIFIACFSNMGYSASYRSTDNGNSWVQNGPGGYVAFISTNNYNGNVFMTSSAWDGVRLFRTTNNGDNWVQMGGVLNFGFAAMMFMSNGEIIAGNGDTGIHRSTNYGTTWLQTGLTNVSVSCFARNGNGDIFAGADKTGIYCSTDNGSNWTKKGMKNSNVLTLAINNTNGYIYSATVNGGVYLSTNNGNFWSQTNMLNEDVLSLATNHNGYVFVGTSNSGLYRSLDNGSNWVQINSNNFYSLATNDLGHIFAGTDSGGVFLSTNNGDNWTQINIGSTSDYVASIEINNSGYIFAGTANGGGVFRSTNNGTTWTQSGLTNILAILSFAINSSGHIFAGTNNGVYRSIDNGNNWTQVGLINTGISSLKINNGGYIYSSTNNGGIYCSTDNGNTWTQINAGLTNLNISSLAVNKQVGYIFAGTKSSGVWRENMNQVNSIVYPKLTLNAGTINTGQSILITGSDFTKNGSARVNISGPGTFQQSNVLTVNSNGGFTSSFITNSTMSSGIYNIQGTDSVSSNSAPTQQFQLLNTSTTVENLKITYPIQNSSFFTNDDISIDWQDKMMRGSNYPMTGSERDYKYIVEYSINGGNYQNIATIQGQAYVNNPVNLSTSFKLSAASNNVVVRVKDGYVSSHIVMSNPFNVIASPSGNINVILRWDYSFPDPGVPCKGVAADGVSRIYLELSKITSAGSDISNVKVQLSDGVNSDRTKLGKVKVALNTTSYSLEANGITSITETDNSSKSTYDFWYVSPDDFVGNNVSDTASSFRTVNANFTINYVGGGSETITKSIKIVRPPLMMVHGIGGSSLSFDNFQSSAFGKFIDDYRFASKRAVTISMNSKFLTNAFYMCPDVISPNDPNFYNTIQGQIYDIRSRGYASNQVDYVGHSMGGSVLRSLLDNFPELFYRTRSNLEYKNYESGYTHKVITIGTPHNGSPWADILNRYLGDVPERSFVTLLNQKSIIFDFIEPYYPYYITEAVSDLKLNGGIKFKTSNIKAHLIAGNFFPGNLPSLPNVIPQTAIDFVHGVGNDILEQALNKLLQVASIKEPDPILKEAFLNLLSLHENPVSMALNFLETAAIRMDVINMVAFLPQSDLIVHKTSQLANYSENNSNVTVVDDWVAHAIIRPELENTNIGNEVSYLLSAPINGGLFANIQASTNEKVYKHLLPLDSSPIVSIIDTNRIKLVFPIITSNFAVDSTIQVLVDIKDTTNLRLVNLYFQNKDYAINNFQPGLNSVSIGVNSQLDAQDLTVEGFYLYPDSGLYVYDKTTVQITTTSSLISFNANQEITYLVKGSDATIQHSGVYQNFVSSISNQSSGISIIVNNPSILQFDNSSKMFKALAQGETYVVTTYHGLADTVYVVVFDTNNDTSQSVNHGSSNVIKDYQLYQNYPNPFNPATTINYQIPEAGLVNLKVYDILGREVATLVNENKREGSYNVIFNASKFASGVYIYRLKVNDYLSSKKMILLK